MPPSSSKNPATPLAEKKPTRLKKHGDVRVDEYFWLRERENPKVLSYVEAENAYVKSVMAPTEALQERLVSELRSRIKEDDDSAPYRRGGYSYFSRYQKGQEYPIYLRFKNHGPRKDEVLLNVNEAAKGHKFFDAGSLGVSNDQSQLAYTVDTVGRRIYEIRFLDLAKNKKWPDVIAGVTGNFVWLNDNRTLLYSKQDPATLRSFQIYKHTLGQKGPDVLIYEEKDPEYRVTVSKSLTKDEVYIYAIANSATEVRVADANDLSANFKVIFRREKKHEYFVMDGGDRWFIMTNYKAKNFRLVETTKDKPDRKYWREVIAHKKDSLLEDVLVLKNHIVAQERKMGLTQISYFKRGTKKRTSLKFPDPTYVSGLGTNAEYDTNEFRYDYQSLTRPETVFDYSFETGEATTVKTAEVPGYQAAQYTSERFFAKARDGAKVPVSVVYKKSLFKKGENPLFVYAYGSYGYSTDTYFRRNVVSLLDRGFVFAIAHIRGGSEMGRAWYENGKLLKKKNTFHDFIDVTEVLLKKKFGKKNHVYAMGGSAGGLLMGAIMNMRPDLYRGIIAAVPFVDALTTMLDDTIPLTTNEYDEWGNPKEKRFYKYIKSYSPYDNVAKKAYPNLLITTGFHDSQVQYWEPLKWIAKLRDYNTSSNLLLMKTDMEAGHSGTTGRFQSLKEDALEHAFFLMLEGIEN